MFSSFSLVSRSRRPASFVTTIILSTLPIRLGSLKATREDEGIHIQWIAFNQQNTTLFEIERSTDGSNFSKVHTLASTGTDGDVKYQWMDINPAQGRNYYRIKEVYISGTQEYSTIVSAVFEDSKPGISLYPNPIRDRNFSMDFRNMIAGKYLVNYVNNSGQRIHQETITHPGGYHTYILPVPAMISHGLYRVLVIAMDGTTKTSSSVIIQ